jgi:hypothetical protein
MILTCTMVYIFSLWELAVKMFIDCLIIFQHYFMLSFTRRVMGEVNTKHVIFVFPAVALFFTSPHKTEVWGSSVINQNLAFTN